MKKDNVRFIAEVGIYSALGLVLDFVASLYSSWILPKGGSVSIAMVVIFIMAYRWGLKGGLLTGLLVGTIQILWGYSIGFIQTCLDYILAYTVLGFVGIVKNQIKDTKGLKQTLYIALPIIIVCIIRTLFHVISGILYFETPFIPSIVYNGPFMLISCILCIITTVIIIKRLPSLIYFEDKEDIDGNCNS